MIDKTIGFLGAGQMARALALGFVRAGLVRGEAIWAYDPAAAARAAFAQAVPAARLSESNAAVVGHADVLLLAVKPQSVEGVAAELGTIDAGKLVVSIVAGLPIAKLAERLQTTRLVRVMPNTPCLVGESAAAYCLGSGATREDGQLVAELLGAVGIAFALEEKHLDAVTGLSGSGPAYAYVMIEALADGGVRMGLPRDVAQALAAKTLLGAARMVLETGEHPGALKDRVASPGGTTIAGLAALEERGLRGALIAAVEAATRRSIELGQQTR
jgi:pyrroline-5-carboxylate reductase